MIRKTSAEHNHEKILRSRAAKQLRDKKVEEKRETISGLEALMATWESVYEKEYSQDALDEINKIKKRIHSLNCQINAHGPTCIRVQF